MNSVIGCRVRGASHVRANTVCQDYYKIVDQPEYTIMAVADGHGSSSCPYSDEGSRFAAYEFCTILGAYYEQYNTTENGLATLESFLRSEGSLTIAKQIERAWKKRVAEWHVKMEREIPEGDDKQKIRSVIYHQYGTTLLGAMATEQFVFAFQIGDGDITYIDANHRMPLIQPDKFLGVETYSLSGNDAWKKAISSVSKRELHCDSPCLYMLSTDGMANSFKSQEEFYKAAADYYALFRGEQMGDIGETDKHTIEEAAKKAQDSIESIQGQKEGTAVVISKKTEMSIAQDAKDVEETGIGYLQRNLSDWLKETSEQGCGDDITVVFYYHE